MQEKKYLFHPNWNQFSVAENGHSEKIKRGQLSAGIKN